MGFASLYPSYGLFETGCLKIESENPSAGTSRPRNKNGGPFGPPLMRM